MTNFDYLLENKFRNNTDRVWYIPWLVYDLLVFDGDIVIKEFPLFVQFAYVHVVFQDK